MRTTATCPKCSGKKLIVVHERGFLRDTKVIGRFESWICAACGYTEFYALSPQRLLDAFEDRGETDEDDDGD